MAIKNTVVIGQLKLSPRLKSKTEVSAKSPFVNTVLRQNLAETKVLTLRLDLSLRPYKSYTFRECTGMSPEGT